MMQNVAKNRDRRVALRDASMDRPCSDVITSAADMNARSRQAAHQPAQAMAANHHCQNRLRSSNLIMNRLGQINPKLCPEIKIFKFSRSPKTVHLTEEIAISSVPYD